MTQETKKEETPSQQSEAEKAKALEDRMRELRIQIAKEHEAQECPRNSF